MGKIFRKKVYHLVLVCLALSVFFAVPVSAKTKEKPSCAKNQTVYITNQGSFSVSDIIYIEKTSPNMKFSSVTSSNKEITVKAARYYGQPAVKVNVSPKAKNGSKALITIVLNENKVKYTLKCTVTVKKSAPFKKVTVGTKNITSLKEAYTGTWFYYRKINAASTVKAGKAQKVQVNPDSNIKVTSIAYVNGDTVKQLKNGAKVDLKKGGRLIVEYSYTPENVDHSTFMCGNLLMGYFSIDIV